MLSSNRFRNSKEFRDERIKWRMLLLVGIFGCSAFMVYGRSLKSDLNSLPSFQFQSFFSESEFLKDTEESFSFSKGRSLQTVADLKCLEDQTGFCNSSTSLVCKSGGDLEGACCKVSVDVNEIKDDDPCISKTDQLCSFKDLCVAELIPGTNVGAQCLQEFEQTGGIALYLVIILYFFLALAIVCDDYFCYSLDMLADLIGVSSDVKGATFAAAGSSAPELFVSLADNVISNPPKSVGIGTIVGSAIFNILIIIGASGIAAGRKHGALKLDWRPLTRDSIFYIFSILALIAVVATGNEAEHYEGALLLFGYALYLLFMKYNQRIFDYVDIKLGIVKEEEGQQQQQQQKNLEKQATIDSTAKSAGEVEAKALNKIETATPAAENTVPTNLTEASKTPVAQSTTTARELKSSRSLRTGFSGQSLDRRSSVGSLISKGILEAPPEEVLKNEPYFDVLYWPKYEPKDAKVTPLAWKLFGGGYKMWLSRLYFITVFPINICFRLTIPDARYDVFREDKEGPQGPILNKRRWAYVAEFFMCIVWIGILSQVLVFSAAKFGCLAGISPAVMGLTVLAAGTSVPDTITSIILTNNGEGDASVANAIGSNVFNIFVGLGLPWFIAGFVYGGSAIAVDDLVVSTVFLFGVLIVLIGGLFVTKFQINLPFGIALVVLYIVYVIVTVVLQ